MSKNNEGRCGQKCEIFQRVIGYYQIKSNANPGKLEEYRMRKSFDIHRANEQIKAEQSLFTIDNDVLMEINKPIIDIDDMDVTTAVTTAEMEMLLSRTKETEEYREQPSI